MFIKSHLVVSTTEVHGGEPVGPSQCIQTVINEWKWVRILNGSFIQLPVVHAESET